jgi:hypothetical protein
MPIAFRALSARTQERMTKLREQAEILKANNKSMLVQRMLGDVLQALDDLPTMVTSEMHLVQCLDIPEHDVRVIQDAFNKFGAKAPDTGAE